MVLAWAKIYKDKGKGEGEMEEHEREGGQRMWGKWLQAGETWEGGENVGENGGKVKGY